jgi:hypothetical protein
MFKQRLGLATGIRPSKRSGYQYARWRRGGGVSCRLLTGGNGWLKFKGRAKTGALCGADDTGERENRGSNF